MNTQKELMDKLSKLLRDSDSKYLSSKQIETIFGIPSKTILNRSNLPHSHQRHIPSLRLKGGRKKYFERKVIERMFEVERGKKTQ